MKLSDNNKYLQNFKYLPEIKVGEIRRLVDMELKNESRLVVIVSINRADESAEVVLINNMLEIATPRDILLSTQLTGLSLVAIGQSLHHLPTGLVEGKQVVTGFLSLTRVQQRGD